MKIHFFSVFALSWLLLLISTSSNAQALSGNFTIPGSYLSFSDAVADLIMQGVSDPVVFDVSDGTYNEQISIPSIQGASSVNTITFRGNITDSTLVKLTFSGFSYIVKLDGADFITFRNMHLQSTSTSPVHVVELANGANNNKFINNKIEAASGSGNLIFSGNTLDNNNTFENNLISGGLRGIELAGVQGNIQEQGNIIKGNTFINQTLRAIGLIFNSNTQVVGNTINLNLISPTSILRGIELRDCILEVPAIADS